MHRPLGLGFAWLALWLAARGFTLSLAATGFTLSLAATGLAISLMATVASAQRGPGGIGGGTNDDQGRRPPVQVQPEVIVPIDPFPRATGIQTVDDLMKELAQCRAGGQLDLVLCLKGDMSSVAVRRLEACLGTYLIPDDPAPIRACFASIPR